MNKRAFKQQIRQIIRECLLETSSAAQQAKQMGLDYLKFGRWGKNGRVTHTSQNGKLVKVAAPTNKAAPKRATSQRPSKSPSRSSIRPKPHHAVAGGPVQLTNRPAKKTTQSQTGNISSEKAAVQKLSKAVNSGHLRPYDEYSPREFMNRTGMSKDELVAAFKNADNDSAISRLGLSYDRENNVLYLKDSNATDVDTPLNRDWP